MKKSYLTKSVFGLIGLLVILALVASSCDDLSIQGVWQLESLDTNIQVGDIFSKDISINFSEMADINILMQVNEDIKSMYFEQDGEIIKCLNLDRKYEILSEKIQIFEEHGGTTEWDYELIGDLLTISMTATLSDYEDIPQIPDLPPIVATMTWVLQQVDPSIVQDVNESEDCSDSPLFWNCARHRHMLIWKLVSDEED